MHVSVCWDSSLTEVLNRNWPGVGEFDIMENVNGIDRVWGVLHCGVNPGGPWYVGQKLLFPLQPYLSCITFEERQKYFS